MKTYLRFFLSACLAIGCVEPALAQQSSLGGFLANAAGDSLKKALGTPAVTTGQPANAADAQSLQDIGSDGAYPIPAFDENQADARAGLLLGLRLEYIQYAGLPRVAGRVLRLNEVPPEYTSKLASTNHQNSFEERDFLAFAQPYLNWGENYLMKPQIFVSKSDVPAAFHAFSPQENGFPVDVSFKRRFGEEQQPFTVTVTFGDNGNRDLENIRSTNGITAVAYVAQQHGDRFPYAYTLLALQLFDTKSGRSLVVTTFADASADQKAFIKANALKTLALTQRTPLSAGSSATSVAAGQHTAYQAALAAQVQAGITTSSKRVIPVSTTVAKGCAAGEAALKTMKLTRVEGANRIDYLDVSTQAKGWTNVTSDFLRDNAVKVGSVFCMAP